MRILAVLILGGCLLVAAATGFAAVPNALSYQGRLLNAGGTPVSNGNYSMVFTIWDAPVGGSSVWTSGAVSVPVADGLFSVNLGGPPMTVLPGTIAADSARWLGITVGTDPEISPRTKLVSSMFSLAGGGGALDDLYVNEIGDTITGTLVITDSIAVGTTAFEAPHTFRASGRWSPAIGNGFGDFRISDGTRGFSIGIAGGGGGAGHVRMWPSGGSQLVTIATPNSGDQFWVDGNLNKVFTLSPFSVNTSSSLAPLTVQSADNWRWDFGTGLGDIRVADQFGQGLSIGIAGGGGGAGTVRFWSSGGLVEDLFFGSPTFGDIFQIYGLSGQTQFNSPYTYWFDSGVPRAYVDAGAGAFVVLDSAGGGKGSIGGSASGVVELRDDDYTSTVSMWGGVGSGGLLFLNRDDGNSGVAAFGGSSGSAQGGYIDLFDGSGSFLPTIELAGAETGDNSAVFPQDAINSLEVLDEPGIATSRLISGFGLSASSISQNILTVAVSIPAAGYVVVEGSLFHKITGNGSAFGWVQISETSNRARETGHYNWTGSSDFANAAAGYGYFTTPVRRVYSKTAGTYTFYLQGNLWESNTAGVSGSAFSPSWLQATYYPTSYGSVQTIVESAGDNPEVTPVTIDDPQTGQKNSAFVADLTYYEKKAREAKLAELQARNARLAAELELARARERTSLPSAANNR